MLTLVGLLVLLVVALYLLQPLLWPTKVSLVALAPEAGVVAPHPSCTAALPEESAKVQTAAASLRLREEGLDLAFDLGVASGFGDALDLAEVRVEEKRETIDIPFDTIYQYSEALAAGEQEILQQGINGSAERTLTLTYHDGKLFDSKQTAEKVLREARPLIILTAAQGSGAVVEADPALAEAAVASEANIVPVSAAEPLAVALPEEALNQGKEEPQEFSSPEKETPFTDDDVTGNQDPQPADTAVAASGLATAGGPAAAEANFQLIAGLIGCGDSASVNGNSLTIAGMTFAISETRRYATTSYDGYECARWSGFRYGDCNPTASGILAQRGIVAVSPQDNLPMGTVVYVEGYGLAVVADITGMGPDLIDLCFDPHDCENGLALPAADACTVYVLTTP